MSKTSASPATLSARAALHAPIKGEPTAPPIPQTTAWAFRTLEDADNAFSSTGGGELYARLGTPLHAAVESSMAALEGMEAACIFSTGMAALTATLDAACPPGSTLLASRDLYGTTDTYMDGFLKDRNVKTVRVDCADDAAVQAALEQHKPTAILLEVLTNPTLKVVRLDQVARRARAAGAMVLVDGTFLPPVLMRAKDLGADAVMHSASKSLAGHGDVSAGVVSGAKLFVDRVRQRRTVLGAHLGAMEAYLLARGLRTLHPRVEKAGLNALYVAHWLESRRANGKLPQVARVIHPSLPGHAHGVWLAQRTGGNFGMMVGVDLAGGGHAAAEFVRHLTDIRLVPSLGDLCTSVTVPARSSHRGVPAEERARRGISDGFIRISVGIEDPVDLVADLGRALAAAH